MEEEERTQYFVHNYFNEVTVPTNVSETRRVTYCAVVCAFVAGRRVIERATTPVQRVTGDVRHSCPVEVHLTSSVGHYHKLAWSAWR